MPAVLTRRLTSVLRIWRYGTALSCRPCMTSTIKVTPRAVATPDIQKGCTAGGQQPSLQDTCTPGLHPKV